MGKWAVPPWATPLGEKEAYDKHVKAGLQKFTCAPYPNYSTAESEHGLCDLQKMSEQQDTFMENVADIRGHNRAERDQRGVCSEKETSGK